MDRRQFLASNAAAGLIAATTPTASHSAKRDSATGASLRLSNTGIDRERASDVMRRLSLDALVLSRSENVRYATGTVPVTTKLGFTDASYAIVPADPAIPVSLLVFQFPYYYSVADCGMAGGVQAHLVASGPTAEPFFLADDPVKGTTQRERNRRKSTLDTGAIHPDFTAAFAAALPESLRRSGSFGYDTLEAMQLIAEAAPQAAATSGETAIRHMRLIKTAYEIEAMSHAAQVNREAAHLAAQAIRGGDTISAIQANFGQYASKLGNRPEFMVVDTVVAENYAHPVRDGTAVLIDCVSSRYGYNGDYGRTVFLGEPRKSIAGKAKAVGQAWSQLRSELKPGQTFSQISARGTAILASIDPSIFVPFGPHSVGLAHTEQPMEGFDGKPLDIALEPGMIISVDCPLMQVGPEGTVHLEDLVLITQDGARPIHSVEDQIIIV